MPIDYYRAGRSGKRAIDFAGDLLTYPVRKSLGQINTIADAASQHLPDLMAGLSGAPTSMTDEIKASNAANEKFKAEQAQRALAQKAEAEVPHSAPSSNFDDRDLLAGLRGGNPAEQFFSRGGGDLGNPRMYPLEAFHDSRTEAAPRGSIRFALGQGSKEQGNYKAPGALQEYNPGETKVGSVGGTARDAFGGRATLPDAGSAGGGVSYPAGPPPKAGGIDEAYLRYSQSLRGLDPLHQAQESMLMRDPFGTEMEISKENRLRQGASAAQAGEKIAIEAARREAYGQSIDPIDEDERQSMLMLNQVPEGPEKARQKAILMARLDQKRQKALEMADIGTGIRRTPPVQ